MATSFNLHFSPLLPMSWFAAVIGAALVLLVISVFQRKRALVLRVLCTTIFLAALTGPALISEKREHARDVAALVVDQSASQDMDGRKQVTADALTYIKEQLAKLPDLDVRMIEAPANGTLASETRLFGALEQAMADVPKQRRAGVIMLTDGQVHDAPTKAENYGPLHILLTGKKDEKDRQVKILQAPAYGIAGQNVTIRYVIDDSPNIKESTAIVTLNTHDGAPETFAVPVGEEQILDLPVTHAGQNVFELQVDAVDGEITQANNKAALIVNGVRDRLRVLLVSGQPYAGARTWRDLLTSDPAVDLVHFTILREPDKLDSTPPHELSLIAFPFEELFEIKLYDFDLIIFDRYRLNRILPQHYFKNIVRYVEKGGALLVASGPSYSTDDSIYFTSLMDVLPGAPTGEQLKKPFKPTLTEQGKMHPVTRDLDWPATKDGQPDWGPWLRQVALNLQSGDALMNGADEKPLIILDRVKQGRVAEIASDHIWLWSRGYQGGGPYSELLRRMVHWLMKEPELDEKALDVKVNGHEIAVRSRNYKEKELIVSMTKPDGTREEITLAPSEDGTLQKTLQADQLGIYEFEDKDGQRQFAAVGDVNPPELRGVRTTADILAPLAKESGGGMMWLSETPQPSIKFLEGGGLAGYNWIGLRRNGDYTVKGVEETPLLSPCMAAALLISIAALMWWREGRAP